METRSVMMIAYMSETGCYSELKRKEGKATM
jgi:hypothetical protein